MLTMKEPCLVSFKNNRKAESEKGFCIAFNGQNKDVNIIFQFARMKSTKATWLRNNHCEHFSYK